MVRLLQRSSYCRWTRPSKPRMLNLNLSAATSGSSSRRDTATLWGGPSRWKIFFKVKTVFLAFAKDYWVSEKYSAKCALYILWKTEDIIKPTVFWVGSDRFAAWLMAWRLNNTHALRIGIYCNENSTFFITWSDICSTLIRPVWNDIE